MIVRSLVQVSRLLTGCHSLSIVLKINDLAGLVLLRLVVTVLSATFDVNWGALASPSLQSVLTAVAFTPTARS